MYRQSMYNVIERFCFVFHSLRVDIVWLLSHWAQAVVLTFWEKRGEKRTTFLRPDVYSTEGKELTPSFWQRVLWEGRERHKAWPCNRIPFFPRTRFDKHFKVKRKRRGGKKDRKGGKKTTVRWPPESKVLTEWDSIESRKLARTNTHTHTLASSY